MPELTVMSPSRLRTGTRTRKLSSVTGYNSDATQSFWAVKLSGANPESEWNMREDDEESGSDRDYMVHHLMIKTVTLGMGISKNEEQVVEIETYDMNQKLLNIPVINMISGVHTMMNMDLEFNDRHKVTFRLTAGTGPVYLSGVVVQENPEEEVNNSQEESMYTETETTATDDNGENGESEDLGEEEAEDEEEEEEEDEEVQLKGKVMKRKSGTAITSSKSKQRGKMEDKEESEEDESEDEEDEEDEEEMDIGSKKKKKPTVSPKASKSPRGKADKKSPVTKDKKKSKKGKAK